MLARFIDRIPAVLVAASLLPCLLVATAEHGEARALWAALPAFVVLAAYLAAGRRGRRRR